MDKMQDDRRYMIEITEKIFKEVIEAIKREEIMSVVLTTSSNDKSEYDRSLVLGNIPNIFESIPYIVSSLLEMNKDGSINKLPLLHKMNVMADIASATVPLIRLQANIFSGLNKEGAKALMDLADMYEGMFTRSPDNNNDTNDGIMLQGKRVKPEDIN